MLTSPVEKRVFYVGMTNNPSRRKSQHKNSIKGKLYPELELQVLITDLDQMEARVWEQIYMTVFFAEIYAEKENQIYGATNKIRAVAQNRLENPSSHAHAILLSIIGDQAENEYLAMMDAVHFY